MNVVIQFTKAEEAKAIPILLRHSSGTIFPDRTYVVDASAAQALKDVGVCFRIVASSSPVKS